MIPSPTDEVIFFRGVGQPPTSNYPQLKSKFRGKNMSGSDSAGVNAMVPGRKCEWGAPRGTRGSSALETGKI